MPKIVRNVFSIDDSETVIIPDVAPSSKFTAEEEKIDPAEQLRLENEEFLRKEYDRIYQEAYNSAAEQANSDIAQMRERLMEMAEKERQAILETAQKEAIYISESAKKGSEDIIKQAQDRYTEICQEAYQTGFTKGFKAKVTELENFVKYVNSTIDRFKSETQSELRKVEEQIGWFAIEIVDKIMHVELSKDNTILTDMIKEALKTVRDAEYITIELSDDLKSLSKKIKDITKDTDSKIEVKVLPSDTAGSVVLQLDDRIIDISIFTQLANIKELFIRGF